MRSISKSERCFEAAKKRVNQATSMHYAIILAPSKKDKEVCKRKYDRAVKHAYKLTKLGYYYGGNR